MPMELLRYLWGSELAELLAKHRNLVKEENRKLLAALSGTCFILMLGGMMLQKYTFTQWEMLWVYGICLLLFVAMYLVAVRVLPKHPRYIEPSVVVFLITCFLYALFAGVIFYTKYNAVSFHIFMLLLPLLFLVHPAKILALQVGVATVFCTLSIALKIPELAVSDVCNAVGFGLLSIVVARIGLAIRLQSMQMLDQQRQTREHLDNIVNSVGGGIVIVERRPGKSARIRFCSEGICRMLHVTHDYLLDRYGTNLSQCVHPEDRLRVRTSFAQAVEGGSFESVFRVSAHGKRYVWVNANVVVHPDSAGGASYYANFTDVTAQLQSQEKLQHIYDVLQESVLKCRCDENWTVIDCNRQFFGQIGYTRDEFQAEHQSGLLQLLRTFSPACELEAVIEKVRAGKSFSERHALARRNGDCRFVWISGQQITEDDETYLYCSMKDVTEEKLQKDALVLSKRSLTAAINHAELRYWEYDRYTNRAYLLTREKNGEQTYRVMEDFPESWLRKGLLHEEDVAAYRAVFDALRRGERECAVDVRILSREGEYRWRRIRYTTILDAAGLPIKAIATAEDIDEYKDLSDRFAAVMGQNGITAWEYDIEEDSMANLQSTGSSMARYMVGAGQPAAAIAEGYVHPEDAEAFCILHQRVQQGAKRASCQLRCRGSGTAWRWYRLDYTTVFTRNGRPVKAFGSATDVTESVRAKQRYEEVTALQQMTAQDSLISCVLNLTTGKVEQAGGKIAGMWHLDITDVDEELAMSTSKVIGEKDRAEHGRLYDRAYLLEQFAEGHSEHHLTVQQMLSDGSTPWLYKTVKMMRNPVSGDIIAFAYAVDVTEKVGAEKLVEGILAAEFDYAGLVYAKTGRYTVFSYPKGEDAVIPRSGGDFNADNALEAQQTVHPEDRDRFCAETMIAYMRQRLRAEGSYSLFYRSGREGAVRNKKLHIFFSDREAEIICIVCTDVTDIYEEEQKKNDVLRHALTIAQQSGVAKSAFLSAMSHDIRTPLNAILGMVRIAREDLDNREQMEESCRIIESSGLHLLSLVNDILDMSKIENGKMEFVQEEFQHTQELERLRGIFKPIFEKKHQKFELEVENLSHDACIGDAMRIQRVLSNLLSNASKFTPEGGSIHLKLTEIPSGKQKLGYYRYEVADSGIGMKQGQLERIFEAFYRIGDTRGGNVEGTGLGLSIAKQIVEAQGGTITVKSEEGKGTTFVVEYPLRLPDTVDTSVGHTLSGADAASADLSGLRVLLVEDHPINILVAKRMLEKRGAQVHIAENGQLGYDMFMASQPEEGYEVIFMDVQMPVMNGYETARAIRESRHAQAKTVPLIAMTANAFADDVKKCMDAGMNGHIAKPVSVEAIVSALYAAGVLGYARKS